MTQKIVTFFALNLWCKKLNSNLKTFNWWITNSNFCFKSGESKLIEGYSRFWMDIIQLFCMIRFSTSWREAANGFGQFYWPFPAKQ